MNYAYTKVCLDYFARKRCNETQTVQHLNGILMRNMKQVNYMMLNLLDSHDTERFFTLIGKDKKKLETAIALTMFMPGTPCLYYGTEHAMEGGYDPDCRRCFNWDKTQWDLDFFEKVKSLLALKKNPILQLGETSIIENDNAINVIRSYEGKNLTLKITSPNAYTIV